MVFAAAVNRGLGSRTGAGRVLRELPTEPGPPRALKPPFSRSREKGRFHHGLLGRARSYFVPVLGRLGLPEGTTSTTPTLPPNVPRLGRVWYFIENARMIVDLAIKIATYITCLEALLSTDSLELAHK